MVTFQQKTTLNINMFWPCNSSLKIHKQTLQLQKKTPAEAQTNHIWKATIQWFVAGLGRFFTCTGFNSFHKILIATLFTQFTQIIWNHITNLPEITWVLEKSPGWVLDSWYNHHYWHLLQLCQKKEKGCIRKKGNQVDLIFVYSLPSMLYKTLWDQRPGS